MSRSFRIASGIVLTTLFSASLSFAYQQIECVREIGQAGKKAKERTLNSPRAIALSDEQLYIADTDAHRVLVLDREGQTVMTWGKKGDEPGEFKSPASQCLRDPERIPVVLPGNDFLSAQSGLRDRLFGRMRGDPTQAKLLQMHSVGRAKKCADVIHAPHVVEQNDDGTAQVAEQQLQVGLLKGLLA